MPAMTVGKNLKVTARTHERVRELAKEKGLAIGDLADLLLEHGVDQVEAGRLRISPARLEPSEEEAA